VAARGGVAAAPAGEAGDVVLEDAALQLERADRQLEAGELLAAELEVLDELQLMTLVGLRRMIGCVHWQPFGNGRGGWVRAARWHRSQYQISSSAIASTSPAAARRSTARRCCTSGAAGPS
jgi:hypothetical protein